MRACHLAVNMLYLSTFANNVEVAFGRIGFLGMCLVAGIAAGGGEKDAST
jgi:membrane associated rhomboid family serine protease